MHQAIDPKIIESLQKIKKMLKEMAESQKQVRLAKCQKDVGTRVRITVLHRLYLKLRNKPYDDVHKIREGWEGRAERYEGSYKEMLGIE